VSLIESIAAFDNAAACSGVNWRDDMENIVTRILAEPGAARSGQSTYADAATDSRVSVVWPMKAPSSRVRMGINAPSAP